MPPSHLSNTTRRRASSSSTVRVSDGAKNATVSRESVNAVLPPHGQLWVHDDGFSTEEILINPSILARSRIGEGDLIEIISMEESTEVLDFEARTTVNGERDSSETKDEDDQSTSSGICLCIAKLATSELLSKHPGLEVSITKIVAEAWGLRSRSRVILKPASFDKWTASHIELSFRDAYLARSDMLRLVSQELVNKVVYKGQKISFLGSMKLTVKDVHVNGHRVSTGFFAATTIPVFRSEAARYVLFIQMTREMWDFDAEGNGEIMFNRVINGFLPDLFRRWVQLEVRHLVSIVMFGRLEYDRYDFSDSNPAAAPERFSQSSSASSSTFQQDFFRVVVTDMASAQWTTILNELKKDFRVFLRDISLHAPASILSSKDGQHTVPKITGRPSTALKGNILEAINLASSQFANDYIDRDLIRTGVSTIIITAGTGVFDVDRDLLNLTSESLINNGIGIDIVCLSPMPLHSVPLFRYRLPQSGIISRAESNVSSDLPELSRSLNRARLPAIDGPSALSSFTSTSANYFSRFPSAFPSKSLQSFGYGIPHWIDLSYWTSSSDNTTQRKLKKHQYQQHNRRVSYRQFTPRVRMYELQMMGLMELGMADISIPYIIETTPRQRRPRHMSSVDFGQLPLTRDTSHAPSYFRKNGPPVSRQRDGATASIHRSNPSDTSLEKMNAYDESVFVDVGTSRKPSRSQSKNLRANKKRPKPASQHALQKNEQPVSGPEGATSKPLDIAPRSPSLFQESNNDGLPKMKPKGATPRISRTISYALRGLAPPLRSSHGSEAGVENIKAPLALAATSLMQANAAAPSEARAEPVRSASIRDIDSHSVLSAESSAEHPTKPILITSSSYRPVSQQVTDRLETPVRSKPYKPHKEKSHSDWPESTSHSSADEENLSSRDVNLLSHSIPNSTLPFIRNVNASNPLKRNLNAASLFGRWQHLYPHEPRASTVKWRSLCTPASVPLTTEDFPSAESLSTEYDVKEHHVHVRPAGNATEAMVSLNSLVFEMMILRLSHGYQIIIGDKVRKVVGSTLCETSLFHDPTSLSQYGDTIMMYMGNTIQKLYFNNQDHVHVTIYNKRDLEIDHPFRPLYNYDPNIRTILATEYTARSMELRGFSEEYPWEVADNYLADGEIDSEGQVNKLRFWRARFVLLPVEPPSNTWRPQLNNEENEEEMHLLGIRALTQMWQRARFTPASERKVGPGRMAGLKRRDQNPLEIKFETLNPSELVATELDKLLALEENGEAASLQLLPDSEKLDKDTPMAKLAQAIQSEKGIEFKNRRWHLRLHYNCFQGEELTNWLWHNVKGIETRDEAVEFGKQLMNEGLFEHVNGKHNFKDGHYFYSLKPEFRAPRPELRASWFPATRRTERSIPPTPLSEQPSRELPITTRSRSGSSLAYSLNPATPLDASRAFLDKRKKTVTLTKMIRLDVDPRKRSNRSEIVNLHYDRFHNPENCYHIELSWLNATSKLVDDALGSWTTQAEKYGLKLVEVPIAEAHRIPDAEPFRRTFTIKLALEPPKRQLVSQVLTTSSFTPQPYSNQAKHFYQKLILKRFNFVLDLEGTSEFPDNVDVQFSSAGLEYKYTQYVHRSGVCLAQITEDGSLLLLANRLYNARFANSKEINSAKWFDNKREPAPGPGLQHRPPLPPQTSNTSIPMQASGIIGLNLQSPRLSAAPSPSPLAQATADVFGSRSAISTTTIAQYVTPEQIKDELSQFCSDTAKLEQFYKENGIVSPSTAQPVPNSTNSNGANNSAARRSTGAGGGAGTSSSVLNPIPDANEGIPEFVLPESIASPSTVSSGFGFGALISRRARASVAYESVAEMLERTTTITATTTTNNNDSSSRERLVDNNTNLSSGDVSSIGGDGSGSGHLELLVRSPTTPGLVGRRIEEGIQEGMRDSLGSPSVRSTRS